ncbi:MAG TPA: D-sedoheptulose 7-phosphate isomerase [Vicinamibacterales bacterium]|jgi:D-sedoheptulose 7-phosphate isomerase
MTAGERHRALEAIFAETVRLHQEVQSAGHGPILAAAEALRTALAGGRKVLVCGNGGSAADAQHFAAELVGRFVRERAAWPAMALTTDTSTLTAIGNDYGFDRVFARQVEAHGHPGDLLLGISTSGGSPNVMAAVTVARTRGLMTIGLTGGDGGALGRAVDIHLNVPTASAARAQEVHCTILHVLCDLVEAELTGA